MAAIRWPTRQPAPRRRDRLRPDGNGSLTGCRVISRQAVHLCRWDEQQRADALDRRIGACRENRLQGCIVRRTERPGELEGDPQRARRADDLRVLAHQADTGGRHPLRFQVVAQRAHGARAGRSHR
jgi:hypothetical protein